MTKRLFLFAGFAPNGIDESLLVYLEQLHKYGDIILIMDSDTDITSAKPYTIYANAKRHGEYDFGSYKRAWEWFTVHGSRLTAYDFIYLVNDSVYLTGDINLEKLEKSNADATGMVWREHKSRPHIQSWFIGMTPAVFLSKWFDEFIMSVKHHDDKGVIARLYEQGFTRKLIENNLTYYCEYTVRGRQIYNDVKRLFLCGLPFIKKLSFTRHNGELGCQINYVLNNIQPKFCNAILDNANRIYGKSYTDWLLTKNPFKILIRKIKYAFTKVLK